MKKKKTTTKSKKLKNSFKKIGLTIWIVVVLSIFVAAIYLFKDLPSPTKLRQGTFPVSTEIYDRNGKLLYEIFSEQNRTPIKLSEVPDEVRNATIAIEDKDFYKHQGFAFRGIVRAVYNIVFRKNLQGGSTITQQLVKTALLTPERTIKRKIREAVLSWITEVIYSKDEILEMYLNHVPYGGTAYGIEQAAKLYFGKKASQLNLAEATLLAGLPAAPSKYSPFGANPKFAKTRQNQVLTRMVEDKYINEEKAIETAKQELSYIPQTTDIKAPHFVMYVKDLLVEEYGSKIVEQGGLRVTTSLDLDIQEFAESTVASEVAKLENMAVTNGATIVTMPKTGEVFAMVGSKNYFDQEIDGNVNITTSLRQPGSSIKPINYATGLINNHTLATLFLDISTCFTAPGQPQLYCPHNYDGKFHGPVRMRSALANSYNIPAVKMLALNGIEAMMSTAKQMGITTWNDNSSHYGLSLTLGGGEVKMTEMATAFGVFANLGNRVDLNPILKIEDYQGKIYYEFIQEGIESQQVLSAEVSYLISHILSDDNARAPAFGLHSQLYIPDKKVAVKTGTTDHPSGPRDNWTIGYTPSFLIATWVGNNDNSPMNPWLVSGVTGAAPIWNKITSFVLKDKDDEFWPQPENIVSAVVCNWQQPPAEEGQEPALLTECQGQNELFIKGTEKQQSVGWVEKKQIWIDKDTNKPPEEGKTDNLELREHVVGHESFVYEYCLTCPHEEEKPQVATLDEKLIVIPKKIDQEINLNN
ncbi:transglycosylase domain-containing protein [Patescibacteria group bacterium]